ncbi:trypco2 family protein [Kitasatospora hibisci]|uniref:trypco2 family protein n=1 Tax=Kitasatospora hibisci TaxID=3369522 RepID=UPI0037552A4B
MVFGLGEIAPELGMELTRTRGADAGLLFSVVSLGGRAEKGEKSTHKVTVRLEPPGTDNGPVPGKDKEQEPCRDGGPDSPSGSPSRVAASVTTAPGEPDSVCPVLLAPDASPGTKAPLIASSLWMCHM